MIDVLKEFGSRFSYIDSEGLEHEIDKHLLDKFVAEDKYTLKVEGLEAYYTEYSPKTVHVFIAPTNAKSFPMHKDPYDVLIVCVEGTKTFEIEGRGIVEIKKGETLLLNKNLPHRAINIEKSIILSIGD